MKFVDYLMSKGISKEQFKYMDRAEQKRLRSRHQESVIEYNKILDDKRRQEYEKIKVERMKDTTDEELYGSMYKHLYGVFGPFLEFHRCSGKLKLTNRYLNKYAKSKKQKTRILDFVREHGGYCDCEVLLNCPMEMQKME